MFLNISLCMRKVVYTVPDKVYVSCPVEQTLKCDFRGMAALFSTQLVPLILQVQNKDMPFKMQK
jgi:hypothetical protein